MCLQAGGNYKIRMISYFVEILDKLTLVYFVDDRGLTLSHSLVSIPITKILAPVMLWVIAIFCMSRC